MISVKSEKVTIKQLIMLALNSPESGWTEEDGDKEELANQACDILQQNSVMLKEYFSLHITDAGNLHNNLISFSAIDVSLVLPSIFPAFYSFHKGNIR